VAEVGNYWLTITSRACIALSSLGSYTVYMPVFYRIVSLRILSDCNPGQNSPKAELLVTCALTKGSKIALAGIL
jgi:hypothetical protein